MSGVARWLAGLTIVASGCAAAACATSLYQLSREGAGVRVMRGDPPTECTELGTVESGGFGTKTVERSHNQLRNQAAALGANLVRVETANGLMLAGTAFHCPSP